MESKFSSFLHEKLAAVVQVYVDGYVGEEVRSIMNPRLGDLSDWSGSGFFIKTSYGEDIIVTNAHVVRNARSIEIMSMLTSEETFGAEVVGIVKDQEPDIAILRLKSGELERFRAIASSPIPYLELRAGDEISRGTELRAIGYPLGMTEPNITGGEVSNFASGSRFISPKYVTDAAINPGNSGGPAIDEFGKVIGVNTSIIQNAENIGFITPFNFIAIILKNIFENNSICFADIGGDFQKNSEDLAHHLGMSAPVGIIVSSVDKGGFLEGAQVQKGDVILSLNDEEIDRHGIFIGKEHFHRRNIFDEFKLIPLGSLINLEVWRKGQKLSLKGRARPYPIRGIRSRPIIVERDFLDVWGMTIQPLSYEILEAFDMVDPQMFYQLLRQYDESKERMVVTHIEKESPAYAQEWSIGEVINKVNAEAVDGIEELLGAINSSGENCCLESERGAIGVFQMSQLKTPIKLLNPSLFLK